MNLSWTIRNNVIYELYVNKQNIINPWGVETADSNSFFSLEKGIGYRHAILEESYRYSENEYKFRIINKMYEGKWELIGQDRLFNKLVSRKVKIRCLEDSYFMDFVLRFRFKKNYFEFARISDKIIFHENSNVYYQYPVNEVLLAGKDFDIKIRVKNIKISDRLEPYMYVRDFKDEWIIHARMLPKVWDKEVIKLCNFWYKTRPINDKISNLILKSKKIKKYLWYRNEIRPYKSKILKLINPNAFPMTKICKGNELFWDVEMEIVDKEK